MPAEHDLDHSLARPNRFAARLPQGHVVGIVLDSDVAEVFGLSLGLPEQCDAAQIEGKLGPISLEARWWSGSSERVGWAISPRIVDEVEEGRVGGSPPLYLVPDAGRNLTGGLVVDWQEGKDTVVSVFASASLSMFF